MTMEQWIELLRGCRDNKKVMIPAQLHLRGQLSGIINSFGSEEITVEYFESVLNAEPAIIEERG